MATEKEVRDELKTLRKQYNQLEKQIAIPQRNVRRVQHQFGKKWIRFFVTSDWHVGSKSFKDERIYKFYDAVNEWGADAIYHVGDVIEGMYPNRPGHIYELEDLGGTAQLQHAARLIEESPLPIHGITGNHDDTLMRNGGISAGAVLQSLTKKYVWLGHNEANVQLAPRTWMKLFHPTDGSAYAVSYKLQKLVESLSGGEKPAILLEGHYHKAMYMFVRNVHAFESGTLCEQTPFMRGRKLAAHIGFWMIDVHFGRDGRIESITPRFFPEYNE